MPPLPVGKRYSIDQDDDDELRPIVVASKIPKSKQPAVMQESEAFRSLDAGDILPFKKNPKVSIALIGGVVIVSSLIGLWATGILSTSPSVTPHKAGPGSIDYHPPAKPTKPQEKAQRTQGLQDKTNGETFLSTSSKGEDDQDESSQDTNDDKTGRVPAATGTESQEEDDENTEEEASATLNSGAKDEGDEDQEKDVVKATTQSASVAPGSEAAAGSLGSALDRTQSASAQNSGPSETTMASADQGNKTSSSTNETRPQVPKSQTKRIGSLLNQANAPTGANNTSRPGVYVIEGMNNSSDRAARRQARRTEMNGGLWQR